VYISADVLPKNEGGLEYRLKKLTQLTVDSLQTAYDGHVIVAFIIDTTGEIYGERIVKAPNTKIGLGVINSAKSLRWKAALCNGKKVKMLYTMEVILDISEN
jgi:hypothetical protein